MFTARFIGWVIFLAFLTGCTHAPESDHDLVKNYATQFQETYDVPLRSRVQLAVVSGDHPKIPEDKIGQCHQNKTQRNAIYLKRSWWEQASEGQKWALVWHEMGHCAYYLNHSEDLYYVTSEGFMCPWSLMNSNIAQPECYDETQERLYYIREMRRRIYLDP